MSREKSIKLAKDYEDKAYNLNKKKKKDTSLYEDMIDSYVKAGDEWEDIGRFGDAERNYKMALRYAYGKDKEEIDKKLKSLLAKKSDRLSTTMKLRQGWGLEKKFTFAFLSIITLICALLFVSFSLTGNAILKLDTNNSRWVGMCLFACGLIFTFLYFRKKR